MAAVESRELDRLLVAYQVLGARRVSQDEMVWQTPALSLTAQAFLFSIALGRGATETTRLISALLALAVSLAAIQLLRKHEHLELIDSALLERIERKLGLAEALRLSNQFHASSRKRRAGLTRGDGTSIRGGVLVDRQSPFWWTVLLGIFALAAVAVIVITVVHPTLLP